jgi:hypothetical protein
MGTEFIGYLPHRAMPRSLHNNERRIRYSLVVTVVTQQAAFAQPTNPKKVTICHIPPDNPDERHTITVGAPAVAAHIREHGDYIGACQPVRPEP